MQAKVRFTVFTAYYTIAIFAPNAFKTRIRVVNVGSVKPFSIFDNWHCVTFAFLASSLCE